MKRINTTFPAPYSKQWLRELKKALACPTFQVSPPKKYSEPFRLSVDQLGNLQTARVLIEGATQD